MIHLFKPQVGHSQDNLSLTHIYFGSRSLTPSNAAFLAALTKFSVDFGVNAPPPSGPDFNFSRAISYASAAFSRVSKTPIYLDFPAKYSWACHFPEGLIVTPRRIAAARAAALSFFPPLAALTEWIVAAALSRSARSVSWGDLFFFLGGPPELCFFFLLFADTVEEAAFELTGTAFDSDVDSDLLAPAIFAATAFAEGLFRLFSFAAVEELDAAECWLPYIAICLAGGGG